MEQKLVQIRFREDTAENFTLANPVLASSEPARELDTGLFKLGDGVTPWRDLPYVNKNAMEDLVNALVGRISDLEESNNYNIWLLKMLENNLQNFIINCNDESDLLNASKHGGTCKLSSNINSDNSFNISQPTQLDLNQLDLICSDNYAINVIGTNLIVNTQGNVSGDDCAMFINGDSDVVINGGNYYSQSQSVIKLHSGTCVINGGVFKSLQQGENIDYNQTLQIVDDELNEEGLGETPTLEKQIIIKGGSFYKFNPTSVADNRIKVSAGYQVTQDGDYYIVEAIAE